MLRKGFTLIEMLVASLIAIILATVGATAYSNQVASSNREAVGAAASTVGRQLCAHSVLTQKTINSYQVDDFATIRMDIARTAAATVVAINPSDGPQVALKGAMLEVLEEGTALVVGQPGYELRFDLDRDGCVISALAPRAPTVLVASEPVAVEPEPAPVVVTPPAPPWSPAGPAGIGEQGQFDRAFFSMGNFTATNNFRLHTGPGSAPAAFYVRGDFACNSNVRIDAYVHATGSASLTNNCVVDGVWARGNITTSTQGVAIMGDATSTTGDLRIGNTPMFVGGDVRVAGRVISSDGGTPFIAGEQLEQQTGLALPPAMELPVYRHSTEYWAGWASSDWTSFARTLATNNNAPSWVRSGTLCSVSNANWSINGPILGPATPTVLDARGCSTLEFNGSAGANTLMLRADLTILVNNFTNSGSLTVLSSDGEVKRLRILSPYKTAQDTCGSSAAGRITFQAGGVSTDTAVHLLLYSGHSVALTNGMEFRGQVYGCTVTAANNTIIRYTQVGIPAW